MRVRSPTAKAEDGRLEVLFAPARVPPRNKPSPEPMLTKLSYPMIFKWIEANENVTEF